MSILGTTLSSVGGAIKGGLKGAGWAALLATLSATAAAATVMMAFSAPLVVGLLTALVVGGVVAQFGGIVLSLAGAFKGGFGGVRRRGQSDLQQRQAQLAMQADFNDRWEASLNGVPTGMSADGSTSVGSHAGRIMAERETAARQGRTP